MITYVKSATKVRKMTFFAHSMGTTSFFVMMHTFPDMSSYFTRCVALAPVINVSLVFEALILIVVLLIFSRFHRLPTFMECLLGF